MQFAMSIRRFVLWVGVLFFVSTTVSPQRARAEAGVASCSGMELVEVFAGAENCPAAQYVMFQIKAPGPSDLYSGTLSTHDHCQQLVDYFGAFVDEVKPNPPPAGTFLVVGTPAAQGMFGITFDGVANAVLSAPAGHLSYDCGWQTGDFVVYGDFPKSFAPALTPGYALKHDGSTWQLGLPQPKNRHGEVGTVGTCPTGAGGVSAKVSGSGGYASCPEDGGAGGGVANAGGSGAGNGGAGGTTANAPGSDPSTPKTVGGCGSCRVGVRVNRGAWLGFALMLTLGWRRRRVRPKG